MSMKANSMRNQSYIFRGFMYTGDSVSWGVVLISWLSVNIIIVIITNMD